MARSLDLGTYKNKLGFMEKLVHMLQTSDASIVHWNADGTSFIVENLERFSDEVLAQYLRTSNFASFVRQLNYYGFRKVAHMGDSKATVYEFRHDKFRRDAPHLVKDIRRRVGVDLNAVREQAKSELDAVRAENAKLQAAADAAKAEAAKFKALYEATLAKLQALQASTPAGSRASKAPPRAPRKRLRATAAAAASTIVLPTGAKEYPVVAADGAMGHLDADSAVHRHPLEDAGPPTPLASCPPSNPVDEDVDVDAMLNLSLDDNGAPPAPPVTTLAPMVRSSSGFSIESFELDPALDLNDIDLGSNRGMTALGSWFDQNPGSPVAATLAPTAVGTASTVGVPAACSGAGAGAGVSGADCKPSGVRVPPSLPVSMPPTMPVDVQAKMTELSPEEQRRVVARVVGAVMTRYLQHNHAMTLPTATVQPPSPTPSTASAASTLTMSSAATTTTTTTTTTATTTAAAATVGAGAGAGASGPPTALTTMESQLPPELLLACMLPLPAVQRTLRDTLMTSYPVVPVTA